MSKTPKPRAGRLEKDLTRRTFLRNTAITATALSYSRIAARAAGREPSDAINFALVGYGAQALNALVPSLSRMSGIRFAGVCDILPTKQASAQRSIDPNGQLGMQKFGRVEEMLEKMGKELDCVIVATADWMHAPLSRLCLEAGKDVYCEKMMSNSIEAAQDMIRAQRQTGRLLQIGHQRRSNPRYVLMRDKILREHRLLGQITHLYGQWNRSPKPPLLPRLTAAELEIIKKEGYPDTLQYANWRWFHKFGGGPISDLGAHQIDIFNWILGVPPKSLTASGGRDYYIDKPLEGGGTYTYEHLDNAILTYEYDVPGHGLVRAVYQVLTTTGSQGYYEKIMGIEGTVVISEEDKSGNQVYREVTTTDDDDKAHWEKLLSDGILRRPRSAVYHKFWERPTNDWHRNDPWLATEGAQDIRVSKSADPYELPALPKYLADKLPHQHHLENFFNTVRQGGKQTDLNCPVEDAYRCCRAVLAINDAVRERKTIEFKPEDFQVT
jgi:predicted dehydrogenase